MKYDSLVNKLLEDFNVLPQSQVAPSTGPDQGMTHGDLPNTFPSMMSTVKIPNIMRKKRKKRSVKK
jgi:hypothetical protein